MFEREDCPSRERPGFRALCDGVALRYDRLVGIGGLDDQAPHLF
jgi:hypothetical protein